MWAMGLLFALYLSLSLSQCKLSFELEKVLLVNTFFNSMAKVFSKINIKHRNTMSLNETEKHNVKIEYIIVTLYNKMIIKAL